jgi:hypothetical protein
MLMRDVRQAVDAGRIRREGFERLRRASAVRPIDAR